MIQTSRPIVFVCPSGRQRGAILIFVLVVALGLVTVTLYFAHSMSLEYRAEDNDVAQREAEQACEGARRYVCSLLNNAEMPGRMPDLTLYENEKVQLGNATFWLVGRGDGVTPVTDRPIFGLADEASKINITSATQDTLALLPNMTTDIASAIVEWRNSDTSQNGTDTYQMLNPPYHVKGSAFESVDELRLVRGIDCTLLYGEDVNRNGMLDPNENDGDKTLPADNGDGKLDPGFAEYLTVWSREPNTQEDGTARINVTDARSSETRTALATLLNENLDESRAQQIMQTLASQARIRSLLEFYALTSMTAEEISKVEDSLTDQDGDYVVGRINVNTAPEAVLACLLGEADAAALVAYRHGRALSDLDYITWVKDALSNPETAYAVGRSLTTRSYQFSADVVAVGHGGHGMHREWFVIDTSTGTARVVYRRDLGRLGWPLGREIRDEIAATQKQ